MNKILAIFFLCFVSALHAIDYFSFATGAYDFLKPKNRTWEIEIEYKFLVQWMALPDPHLAFRPLAGVMATIRGSGYLYGGLNFDILLGDHAWISPGFAAGWYWQGGGKNLGYPLEFRSGVEVGWTFSDGRRAGVHFYHLSNASLSKRNPGEESLVLFYDIPIIKGFPFYN